MEGRFQYHLLEDVLALPIFFYLMLLMVTFDMILKNTFRDLCNDHEPAVSSHLIDHLPKLIVLKTPFQTRCM